MSLFFFRSENLQVFIRVIAISHIENIGLVFKLKARKRTHNSHSSSFFSLSKCQCSYRMYLHLITIHGFEVIAVFVVCLKFIVLYRMSGSIRSCLTMWQVIVFVSIFLILSKLHAGGWEKRNQQEEGWG